MVRKPFAAESSPDLGSVLDAMEDDVCRTIIRTLDEPMTVAELTERCDIPQSTLYRKLELLTDATLLRETTEIRSDGHHASRYEVDFEAVRVALDDERTLEVEIDRPSRTADERLADMWSEVRRGL